MDDGFETIWNCTECGSHDGVSSPERRFQDLGRMPWSQLMNTVMNIIPLDYVSIIL